MTVEYLCKLCACYSLLSTRYAMYVSITYYTHSLHLIQHFITYFTFTSYTYLHYTSPSLYTYIQGMRRLPRSRRRPTARKPHSKRPPWVWGTPQRRSSMPGSALPTCAIPCPKRWYRVGLVN